MIRILHVVSSLGSGGVESFLYNYYMNMDKSKIKFDFIVHGNEKGVFEEKFIELGSRVYHVTPRRKNALKNIIQIKTIINENPYDVIHAHLEYMAFIPLFYAKKKSIRTRISHAHLSNQDNGRYIKTMFISVLKRLTKLYGTHFFGCSKDAIRDLFGDEIALGNSTIIKNAINVQKFTYNLNIRKSLRTQLGIDNNFVIGNIGRFTDQKNHSFLIDIFREILTINKNAKLVLVGEGPLMDNVKEKVNSYGISENVLLLGVRNDISDLMSAFDAFVFPSIYEGLGIVLIEAQASSLHCFTSDNVVPQEANITKFIKYISLDERPEVWAELINSYFNGYKREVDNKSIMNAGYDIKIEAIKLQKFYEDRCYDDK